jgi:hypothetical protein
MDQYLAVAIAAAVSSAFSAAVAGLLRLPWWANILAAVVAWFGLGLHLVMWNMPDGDTLSATIKLLPMAKLFGCAYAVITRGMIGPPEGPLPRSH